MADAEAPLPLGALATPKQEEREQTFVGEWDEEGVYFYQAFNAAIADWAVEHQRLGGPAFKPQRCTWIKPSFAWVLYRSGYASKHNQERILKVKLPHDAVASLLAQSVCKKGGGGAKGRIQWDPARDLMSSEGRTPRRMLRLRAIQIGLKGSLSEQYVASITSIEDVTALAHRVAAAHAAGAGARPGKARGGTQSAAAGKPGQGPTAAATTTAEAMAQLAAEHALPHERPYVPRCSEADLVRLGMRSGATAHHLAGIGRGKAHS